MQFLYPSSLLNPRTVDEHFAAEATLFQSVAKYDTTMNFVRGLSSEKVLYRGWMLSKDEYDALEKSVAQAGARLCVSASEYSRNHYFENWYGHFESLTADSYAFSMHDEGVAGFLSQTNVADQQFVIKSSTKSAKEYWDTACFAPSLDALPGVISTFKEIAEPRADENLIVRVFENYVEGEMRLWWWNGDPLVCDRHPQSAICSWRDYLQVSEFLTRLQTCVQDFGSQFITTDIKLRSDGNFRIIEVGDGQVSEPTDVVEWSDRLSDILSV